MIRIALVVPLIVALVVVGVLVATSPFGDDGAPEQVVGSPVPVTLAPVPTVQIGQSAATLDAISRTEADLKAFLASTVMSTMFQALDPYPCRAVCPDDSPWARPVAPRLVEALGYCRQFSTPTVRSAKTYRVEAHESMLAGFDAVCARLGRAEAVAGAPGDNEFWRAVQRDASRLVKFRPDWVWDGTPVGGELQFTLREVGEYLYHSARSTASTKPSKTPSSPTSKTAP